MNAFLPIELLNYAAEKLDDLCPEVVFLGGAIVSLLLTESVALPPRTTKDVDVAIELRGTILDVYKLDRRLLSLGFINDIEGPVCRYLHGPVVVDVIPVNPESLGDVNCWYPVAIETAQPFTLPNGIEINIIAPVCFIGTKLSAFRSPTREYHDDIFMSRDFGDIIRVIDGRPAIVSEILAAPADLRGYLQEQLAQILNKGYIEEAISEHVGSGRESVVIDRIRAVLP